MNSVVRLLKILPVAVWMAEVSAGAAVGGGIETLDPLVVFGDRSVQEQEIPDAEDLGNLHSTHLGKALERSLGLSFVKRGHDLVDPQIRGLGFDRVVTLINGLPVLHGSPTGTASPLNALGPGSVSGEPLMARTCTTTVPGTGAMLPRGSGALAVRSVHGG